MVRPSKGLAMSATTSPAAAQTERQRRLSILAKAPADRLEALLRGLGETPDYTLLRRPEIGLVMLQGRISGSGAPFAAGEMTVTRAAVRLDSGQLGIGYVGECRPKQAELVTRAAAPGQVPASRRPTESHPLDPRTRD